MKKLSIIIVSYENYDVLKNCLLSIREYNDLGENLEVIVVEQSNDDTIYESLLSCFPEVSTIRNANNGFGAGNNVGASAASGEFLLFLNPDTILIAPLFKEAVAKFEEDKTLGLFGVRLIDADMNHNQSFYFRRQFNPLASSLWRLCDRFNFFIPSKMYITGADMFVRAVAFEEAGRFDERIFMYFEEPDLCSRIENLGYRIGYYPKMKIIHLEGKCSEKTSATARKIDSLKIYCENSDISYLSELSKWRKLETLRCALKQSNDDIKERIKLIDRRIMELDNME